MKIMLEELSKKPRRAHETDAGLDLYSREEKIIPAKSSATFNTGVHIQLPPDTVGLLCSKSGLNINKGITTTGVIDEGYTGSIIVKAYNNSDEDYKVELHDKITQLLVLPILKPELELTTTFEKTARGDKGLGSSGK